MSTSFGRLDGSRARKAKSSKARRWRRWRRISTASAPPMPSSSTSWRWNLANTAAGHGPQRERVFFHEVGTWLSGSYVLYRNELCLWLFLLLFLCLLLLLLSSSSSSSLFYVYDWYERLRHCCSLYQEYIQYNIYIYISIYIYIYITEGSLEVKLPTIWTVEKQRWEESEETRSEEGRCRCAKR